MVAWSVLRAGDAEGHLVRLPQFLGLTPVLDIACPPYSLRGRELEPEPQLDSRPTLLSPRPALDGRLVLGFNQDSPLPRGPCIAPPQPELIVVRLSNVMAG